MTSSSKIKSKEELLNHISKHTNFRDKEGLMRFISEQEPDIPYFNHVPMYIQIAYEMEHNDYKYERDGIGHLAASAIAYMEHGGGGCTVAESVTLATELTNEYYDNQNGVYGSTYCFVDISGKSVEKVFAKSIESAEKIAKEKDIKYDLVMEEYDDFTKGGVLSSGGIIPYSEFICDGLHSEYEDAPLELIGYMNEKGIREIYITLNIFSTAQQLLSLSDSSPKMVSVKLDNSKNLPAKEKNKIAKELLMQEKYQIEDFLPLGGESLKIEEIEKTINSNLVEGVVFEVVERSSLYGDEEGEDTLSLANPYRDYPEYECRFYDSEEEEVAWADDLCMHISLDELEKEAVTLSEKNKVCINSSKIKQKETEEETLSTGISQSPNG